jgi:ATP/maltotriose-dependent transcriptional regulator MalT
MGDIYYEMDSLKQAATCYLQGVEIFEKNNRPQMLAVSLLSLGRLRLKEGRLKDASETLNRCVDICEKHHLKRMQRDAFRFLYEIHKQTSPNSPALDYLEKYTVLNDSLFKETTQKQISDFQVKYETAEKELEIEHQQAQINSQQTRQRIYIASLCIAALILVLMIFILNLRNKRNSV